METTFPIGRSHHTKERVDDEAIEELKSRVQKNISFGTAKPDKSINASVYFQVGGTGDPVEVFIKDPSSGAWYGRTGLSRSNNTNLMTDDGMLIPVVLVNGKVFLA